MKNRKCQDLGEVGIVIINRVVRAGLTKKVTFEQNPLDVGERAFQAENKVSSKALE